jgi:hypothetical protein
VILDSCGRQLRRRAGFIGGLVPVKPDPDENPGAVAYGTMLSIDSDEGEEEAGERREE